MRHAPVVVLVAVVAAVAVSAAAADPAGMRETTRLEPAASSVGGKPVKIWCALTRQAIADASGLPDALAYTPVFGGDTVYLAPLTCSYLLAWMNGKKPTNLYAVAAAMEVLAHEAQHIRGVRDETDAECGALHALPQMVTRFFPLKKRMTMHTLMGYAWKFHAAASPEYRTHAC